MYLTIEDINSTIREIDFCGWQFNVVEDSNIRFLQVEFEMPDAKRPGELYRAKGRKWVISRHMTRSELVLTAFKAVQTALEHEAREAFKYRGRAIFGPHINVEALYEACTDLELRAAP